MNYQVTGNEYVSLPTIRETDGALEGISFLYMGLKGMVEMYGWNGLAVPFLRVQGEKQLLCPVWHRDHAWIPSFSCETEGISMTCEYLAPVGQRGFAMRLAAENLTDQEMEIRVGLEGDWDRTLHTVNESIPLTEGRYVKRSGWNHMFVFSQVPGVPLFAFAPITEDDQPFSEISQGAEWKQEGFAYEIWRDLRLMPGGVKRLDVFFGIGYEEVAAATSAKEMLRQGYDRLKTCTAAWLAEREKHPADPMLAEKLNTNLFFAFFYASGRTLDTEELCMMTSRSPRYYVSAAYWDRDSLLWAFPAICRVDAPYARELLLSVFSRQGRNFGTHSRYIDGTVLEPGFELDELCAPVIAVDRYIKQTGDRGFAEEPVIAAGLRSILGKLEARRHPEIALYSTFLQPTDDMHYYPYLTYDNVLVWKALTILSELLGRSELLKLAEDVRDAVGDHCVYELEDKRMFAWSVDLKGKWDIYDEPPGSLQLLPFYGFCERDDEVWRNTVLGIRDVSYDLSFAGHPIAEIGCRHAPHPWILSICNSLLSGHEASALEHLNRTPMDNGLACESVNEDTGACETGEAFATCAGFLAYAMLTALGV